jgi:hypothetical protein
MSNEKTILSGKFRTSMFEPFQNIELTKTKLTIGNESFAITEISEAFNDFKGFAGVSQLGIRLKNGREIKGLSIKGSMHNMGANVNILLGDFSSMSVSMKNVIDKWVNTINTLILMS